MKQVSFRAVLPERVLWRYGTVINQEPLTLRLPWISAEELLKARCHIEWREKDHTFGMPVVFAGESENTFIFSSKHEAVPQETSLVVDYKTESHIKPISTKELDAHRIMAHEFNSRELSGMTRRIASAVHSEPQENRTILRFLMEISAKLDDIAEQLSPAKDLSGWQPASLMGLSAEGLYFLADIDSEFAYIEHSLGFGENRFSFASLLKLFPFETDFTFGEFYGLKDTVLDNIVKFIFSKEREMIQTAHEY